MCSLHGRAWDTIRARATSKRLPSGSSSPERFHPTTKAFAHCLVSARTPPPRSRVSRSSCRTPPSMGTRCAFSAASRPSLATSVRGARASGSKRLRAACWTVSVRAISTRRSWNWARPSVCQNRRTARSVLCQRSAWRSKQVSSESTR